MPLVANVDEQEKTEDQVGVLGGFRVSHWQTGNDNGLV